MNAGVPPRVAMKVTGHKTRAMFNRNHIVSPADLREVARRLAVRQAAPAWPIALAGPKSASGLKPAR